MAYFQVNRPANPVPAGTPVDVGGAHRCGYRFLNGNTCDAVCTVRVSNSAKNNGREYWTCGEKTGEEYHNFRCWVGEDAEPSFVSHEGGAQKSTPFVRGSKADIQTRSAQVASSALMQVVSDLELLKKELADARAESQSMWAEVIATIHQTRGLAHNGPDAASKAADASRLGVVRTPFGAR